MSHTESYLCWRGVFKAVEVNAGQAAGGGFAIEVGQSATGLGHDRDDVVVADTMLTVREQGKAGTAQGAGRGMGIAFDAGDLHRPATGSQVRPRWCSNPISAAYSIWWGLPPSNCAAPAAAMAQATPTSP